MTGEAPPGACLADTLVVSLPGVGGADVLGRVPQLAAVATAPSPTSPGTHKGTPP